MKYIIFNFTVIVSFFLNNCEAQVTYSKPNYYINASPRYNSVFDIVMLLNDSTFSAIRGTGIIKVKDSLCIYPENGYSMMAGKIHFKAPFSNVTYIIVKRSINLIGESLPTSCKSVELVNKSTSIIMIGHVKYKKLSEKRVSVLLRKYLFDALWIYKKNGGGLR